MGLAGFFKKDGKIYKVYFTILSKILNHGAKIAIDILTNLVLNHKIFKKFGVRDINLWVDNGPHFRSKELLHYLLLHDTYHFTVNYFAPYHGKSHCDQHFGVINRYYNEATKGEKGVVITTTSEFISMYRRSANTSGNYVFFTDIDTDSMKTIDSGYNCFMDEYSPDELDDMEETDNVMQVPIKYSQTKLQFKVPMKHFSQFQMVDRTVRAKLHEEAEVHTLEYTVETVPNFSMSLKIGSEFKDPDPPSKLMKKINSVRKFHASAQVEESIEESEGSTDSSNSNSRLTTFPQDSADVPCQL